MTVLGRVGRAPAGGKKLGAKTVAATTEGHFAALRWARDTYGTDLLWGVEDTRATTAGLERDLTDAGQSVVRVPTQLMARARTSPSPVLVIAHVVADLGPRAGTARRGGLRGRRTDSRVSGCGE